MNSWKLNGIAGYFFRKAICDAWKVPLPMIYREVVHINAEGHILRRDGKVYKLTLTQITNDKG